MRKFSAILALMLWLPASLFAARWLENDYIYGANGTKEDSLSFYTSISQRFTVGAQASAYHNNLSLEWLYSYRLPLMYSGRGKFISFTPFVYPVAGSTRSGASGGKIDLVTSLTGADNDNYLHLTLSGALARQRAMLSGAADKKSFSETAFQLQIEKSFYKQFIFLVSGTGFSNPSGVSNRTLVAPALDHADMAYTGAFSRVTALPEWIMGVQMARSMKPEYDSYLYAGYSKISLRRANAVNSVTAGIRMGLTERATLDFAYNAYKPEGADLKSYYRLLFKFYFIPEKR